jgi:hypothetical protein
VNVCICAEFDAKNHDLPPFVLLTKSLCPRGFIKQIVFWKDMDKEVILYYEALAQIQTLDTILTLTRQSLISGFGHLTCLQFEVPDVLHSSLEYEFFLIYSNDTRFISLLIFLILHEVKTFNSIYFIMQRSV